MKKIFSFTLSRSFQSKGYRIATILISLACFLLPAAIMPIVELVKKDNDQDKISPVTDVYVVDNTDTARVDFNFLSMMGDERYAGITYHAFDGTVEEAAEYSKQTPKSLLLAIDVKEDNKYEFSVIRTKDTEISKSDANALKDHIDLYFRLVLSEKAGISYESLAALSVPVTTQIRHVDASNAAIDNTEKEETDPIVALKPILSGLLPYLNIMLLYFMVLFYGQAVANSVIMEKTSKLMDTFLISVKPAAMIFGKVFAVILTSVIQFLCWIVSLIAGFAVGGVLVKMINPDTEMVLLAFFKLIGKMSGMFSVPGTILALIILISSFALYSALAAIGGALASKPEDLSSTNSLFTMILIVSFFALMASGAMMGDMPSSVCWYDIVPFTAILITPSRLLLGYVPPLIGCISLAIILVTIGVVLWFAGKLYRMMSLYKGNPPKLAQLIKMLKNTH